MAEIENMKPSVLVVGAGPVGLTLALELTRYGIPLRIVDLAAERTDKSKALVVWSRTLELLARAGCADAFIVAGKKVTAANMVAGGNLIAQIGFAGVDTPYPYALMLPQSETERLLEEKLERRGVKVERCTEMIGFTASEDEVMAELRDADGQVERVSSSLLVGCDGAHSRVRHALNLEFSGDTLQSDWMLADVHLKGLPFPDDELATFWHGDGVLAVFPISTGRFRVIADLGRSHGPRPEDPSMERVQAIMDKRGPGGVTAADPVWLAGFRINERKVKNYRVGRVFLAGDAAHVHSPAGGQGMNTGMQDAFNLAWKLALVMRGICSSDAVLESYSTERSAIGDQVLAAAGRLTAIAVLRNHALQSLRNVVGEFLLGLSPVRQAMANQLTEVSIGYAHSQLNGPNVHGHHGVTAGTRAPIRLGEIPFGSGDKPRFALFASHSAAGAELITQYAGLLEDSPRPPLGDFNCLVRPDGYIACTSKADDLQPIADYLARLK